ncbi:hypothetical protein [Caproiciproducens sp. CPB-2]|uniref:hypothetical protein n=1 Tax=Caproiciproducens sp. CPB-2 TaxID=3030017 RepID=UPI0023DA4592|nr:hypothetical protein [Caproiciproducens sp. CPB-2]MDF1496090.1 hypothetical protein [Caproiciproducens sp. CPB-2]
MKKILSIFICGVMLFTTMSVTPVYATTKKTVDAANNSENSYRISKKFTSVIEDYFKNQTAYTVLDETGNEISNAFYKDNIENYNSSDFAAIEKYISNKKISCLSKFTVTKEPLNMSGSGLNGEMTPYAFERQYISKEDNYVAYANSSAYGTIGINCTATLSGSFIYNANTGIITGYSGPTLSFDYEPLNFDDTSSLNVSPDNVSTSAKIPSSKYSITFTANYDVLGTYNVAFPLTFAKNKRITMTGVPE